MGVTGSGLRLPVGDVHQNVLHKVTDHDRAKAARALAAHAQTATELTAFLALLGLDHTDARGARGLLEGHRG
jgi:hypothetical protein